MNSVEDASGGEPRVNREEGEKEGGGRGTPRHLRQSRAERSESGEATRLDRERDPPALACVKRSCQAGPSLVARSCQVPPLRSPPRAKRCSVDSSARSNPGAQPSTRSLCAVVVAVDTFTRRRRRLLHSLSPTTTTTDPTLLLLLPYPPFACETWLALLLHSPPPCRSHLHAARRSPALPSPPRLRCPLRAPGPTPPRAGGPSPSQSPKSRPRTLAPGRRPCPAGAASPTRPCSAARRRRVKSRQRVSAAGSRASPRSRPRSATLASARAASTTATPSRTRKPSLSGAALRAQRAACRPRRTKLTPSRSRRAIDCGTTSCRFYIFDQWADIVANYQIEFEQRASSIPSLPEGILPRLPVLSLDGQAVHIYQSADVPSLRVPPLTSATCFSPAPLPHRAPHPPSSPPDRPTDPAVHPEPGWHEHDPSTYCREIDRCIEEGLKQFKEKGHEVHELKCVGIATQRETTLLWDKETGEALYNASASLSSSLCFFRVAYAGGPCGWTPVRTPRRPPPSLEPPHADHARLCAAQSHGPTHATPPTSVSCAPRPRRARSTRPRARSSARRASGD